MSKSQKGKKKHTDKTKNKMSENRKDENNSFYGKTHSDQQKEKWSKERRKLDIKTVNKIRDDLNDNINNKDILVKYKISKTLLRKVKNNIKPYNL